MRRRVGLLVIGIVVAGSQLLAAQPALHFPPPDDPDFYLKGIGAIVLFWGGLWISWLVGLVLGHIRRWGAWSLILTLVEAAMIYIGLLYLQPLGDVRFALLAVAIVGGVVVADHYDSLGDR